MSGCRAHPRTLTSPPRHDHVVPRTEPNEDDPQRWWVVCGEVELDIYQVVAWLPGPSRRGPTARMSPSRVVKGRFRGRMGHLPQRTISGSHAVAVSEGRLRERDAGALARSAPVLRTGPDLSSYSEFSPGFGIWLSRPAPPIATRPRMNHPLGCHFLGLSTAVGPGRFRGPAHHTLKIPHHRCTDESAGKEPTRHWKPAVALRASVRRHRRAQRHPWLLRSIRPKRARRPSDASVDPIAPGKLGSGG